jgi:integrase
MYDDIDIYAASEPPAPPPVAGAVPFDRLVDELRAIYAPELAAKATWSKLNGVLEEVKALGVVWTSELTVPLVARYCSSRPPGQSANTLASLLSSLKAACTYADGAGYVKSPFKIRKLSKFVRLTPPVDCPHHSREELHRLFDRLQADVAKRTEWAQWKSRRILICAAIAAYAALRRGEVLRLHVEDVDVPGRTIWIRARNRLKTTGAEAPVCFPDALAPLLTAWLEHRLDCPPNMTVPADCPWFVPNSGRTNAWLGGPPGGRALDMLQEVAARAGIPGVSFQSLRVSFATHAEYFGLSDTLISRVLRHTTTRTAATYYRRADIPNMREKVKKIRY